MAYAAATMSSNLVMSTTPWTGALEATPAANSAGYAARTKPASMPGYEPPIAIQGAAVGTLNFSSAKAWKPAKSASSGKPPPKKKQKRAQKPKQEAEQQEPGNPKPRAAAAQTEAPGVAYLAETMVAL